MEKKYYLITFISEAVILILMYFVGMSFLSCVAFSLSFSLVQLLKHPNISEYKLGKKRASFVSLIYMIDDMLRSFTEGKKLLSRWQDYYVATIFGLFLGLLNIDPWCFVAVALVILSFETIVYVLTRESSLSLNSEREDDLRN